MAWKIILENEDREQIGVVSKELEFKNLEGVSISYTFKLLKYLDPYGDTIFNANQIDDLLIDLDVLKQHYIDSGLINEIIDLAIKCKSEPHTYLIFYGD
jgi:hypothetical protein